MKLPIYIVDAFTSRVFGGNQAAVCPLPYWLSDRTLQAIASENNLSETAFLVREEERYRLRWFTPTTEIDLCGHATLAASYVLFQFLHPDWHTVDFASRSGILAVARKEGRLALDFPIRRGIPVPDIRPFETALGIRPREVLLARDAIAILESEEDVLRAQPNLELLKACPGLGVAITARGTSSDFVSRAFFPKVGIGEDPVTGATHCTLAPYWAEQLGKRELHAKQLSARGGVLVTRIQDDRVEISGEAALYLTGQIIIPEDGRV